MAHRHAIEETLKDVQGLLIKAATKIHHSYGGDLEEYISDAYFLYLVNFDKHSKLKKEYPFPLWIYLKVLYGLVDRKRTEQKRQERTGMIVYHALDFSDQFVSRDWVEELSEEARDVINLILRTDKPNRRTVRCELIRLGWTEEQVNDCFLEIRGAMHYDGL
jgi:hypothetical protein